MYKVIYNGEIIDTLENLTYVTYQEKNQLNLITGRREEAYGILSSSGEDIYCLDGLNEPPKGEFKVVTVENITAEEYLELAEEFGFHKDDNYMIEDTTHHDPVDTEIDLNTIKKKKLNQLSAECNKVITNGFNVVLTDNKEYHYDLTVEDQINIATLQAQIAAGAAQVPYHASGELCRFYSAQDIMLIIEKGTEFKTYHVTYYNSLKNYVNAMTTAKEVEAVKYGDPVPKKYRSDVLDILIGG